MILKVAQLGHPVLRLKAEKVPLEQIVAQQMQNFIQDMIETMDEYDGIGIAAPQVHVPLQVFVMGQTDVNPRYPKAPKMPLRVVFNPKLKATTDKKVLDTEGCLSVSGLRGQVPRWQSVEVSGYDEHAKPIAFKLRGFAARVAQHEWDHLQGKVYLDRMKDLSTLAYLEEYTRYWS